MTAHETRVVCGGEVTRRMLSAYEAGELITTCAWCTRIEIDGAWLLAPRSALAAIEAYYTLSHSICDPCALAASGSLRGGVSESGAAAR